MNDTTAERVATERPMRRLGDEMYPTAAPTPKQREAIDQVWQMAEELATLPTGSRSSYLHEIRTHTGGRQRWLATGHTPRDDPHFGPLMAMLDALIADQGLVATRHGGFTADDLKEAEAMATRDEIVFPVRYAWKRKPNPATGDRGERLPAVYRTAKERAAGPAVGSFRVVPRPDDDDREWYDR